MVVNYSPSEEALAKSSMEAEMAEKRELEMIHQQVDEKEMLEKREGRVSIMNPEMSGKSGLTYGQVAACRQKLFRGDEKVKRLYSLARKPE